MEKIFAVLLSLSASAVLLLASGTVMALTDPCSVTAHQFGDITSPPEYAGAFTVPTASQKLTTQITRTIGLKDYYPGYLPQGGACQDRTTHARNLYIESLNRLQADGVQQTFIYNYGPWDNFNNPIWSVDQSDYQIPSTEVAFVVSEATKRGIEVILAWQFTGQDKTGASLPMGSPVTADKLLQMLASFHPLIVNQAKVGAQIGLAGIYADWHAFWIPNLSSDPVLREIWITEMVSIIADIKKVFGGKIYYGANTSIIDPRLAAVIDLFTLSLTVPWQSIDTNQNNALTVDMVKAAYLTSIQQAKADYDRQMIGSSISIPINWVVAVQSKKDYFVNGWTEDGFCVNSCIQLTYTTDNSVQAIGVEAALEAISTQKQFTNGAVDFDTSYWLTDDVTPGNFGWDAYANLYQHDFPNLSQSVRNKPAEAIVRQWFSQSPGVPTILSIDSGPGRVTITLQPPIYTGGGAIVSYSATCTAIDHPNATATSATTTIIVPGLVPGVSYSCTATASNGTYASPDTPATSAIPKPKVDLTPILMLLLD